MVASWGSELWDGFDAVRAHEKTGLSYLKDVTAFIRERAQIEEHYAKVRLVPLMPRAT